MQQIWEFFLRHYRFNALLIGALVMGGIISIFSLPKESAPEVVIPIGVVTTVYPGASALDVEELVTDELEEEIGKLDDLDKYSSTSSEGLSSIVVEFEADSDIDDRIRALKDAVDAALPDLPTEVDDRPVVRQISVTDEPVFVFSVSGDKSALDFKRLADDVQELLEDLPEVSEVKVVGVREREVQVTVDQSRLELYGLDLRQLVKAIQDHNAQVPVGAIEQQQSQHTIRFEGGLQDPNQVSSIPVVLRGTVPVLIRDLAQVRDDFEAERNISRLSVDDSPAQRAVTFEVFKKDGADLLSLVNRLEVQLDVLKKGLLEDTSVFVSLNLGDEIRKDLGNLLWSGAQTVMIVILLLYFFLGAREALVAGISIPLTFLMTFIGLSLLGFTLNFLTLFSLILSLGILVDATIVMTEGMHAHLSSGKSSFEAARETIREFQWPVIAGILTTVAAFVPMLFASGITGQYIRTIPVTVSLVLMSSLFVALGIIPVLGSRFMKALSADVTSQSDNKASQSRFMVVISRWYAPRIEAFLQNRRQQRWFTWFLILLFFCSLALPATGLLKAVLFPVVDADRFFITVEMPIGTVLERTDKVVKSVEDLLYGDQHIRSFVSNVGSSSGQSASGGGGTSAEHLGRFTVNLIDEDDRDATSQQIVQEYRQRFAAISDARVTITQPNAGPPQGAPVEITFFGDDIRELERLTYAAEGLLKSVGGVTDIDSTSKDTPFEYRFDINRQKALQMGLTPIEIAQTLRTALFGAVATKLRLEGEEVDVLVQLDLNSDSDDPLRTRETTIDVLESLPLTTAEGKTVLLGSLVETVLQSSFYQVQHQDGDRIARVTAELMPGAITQEVVGTFSDRASELELQDGYRIQYGGEAEEVQDSFSDMYQALYIGIMLILGILVLQFNSFRQPFFIMTSLPFALIGVFFGLTVTGQPLSFPAFIGVVALVGIVVNDAIILIDQANHNRRLGMSVCNAVYNGAISRLQPVLLTTITTVFGILPLTLSDPVWGPLGFSIIFGLSFATVLTLVMVPMLYLRWVEKEEPGGV
ncbi:MAG: efflux RND transporter permease subunit [bacterium]|nr:efflux RND transporter permease subunit [bacterium]